MRSTPNPPQMEWGDPDYKLLWEDGWREGFKAALKSITTVQDPLPLTLDGEKSCWENGRCWDPPTHPNFPS